MPRKNEHELKLSVGEVNAEWGDMVEKREVPVPGSKYRYNPSICQESLCKSRYITKRFSYTGIQTQTSPVADTRVNYFVQLLG